MGVAQPKNISNRNNNDDGTTGAGAAFGHFRQEAVINAARYTCDFALMICQSVPITSRCLLLVGMIVYI